MKKIPFFIYISESFKSLLNVAMVSSVKFIVDAIEKHSLDKLISSSILVLVLVLVSQSYRAFSIYLVEKVIYKKNIKIREVVAARIIFPSVPT